MKTYHFIGIKGSGMSALAQLLHDLGNQVQGEDMTGYLFTQSALEAKNITIYPFGEAPLNNIDMVIMSNAFNEENSTVLRCKQLGIPYIRYHQFVGSWMKQYKSVAVTGSHGKTTTTGLLTHALKEQIPLCSLVGDGSGQGDTNASLFVFESCEYRRHFLAYQPNIVVITNIDFDHPDYFKNLEDVISAFNEMADNTKDCLVICGDDSHIQQLTIQSAVLRYGFEEYNDLVANNVLTTCDGVQFDVKYQGIELGRTTIPLFGNHNILNALAVIGVSLSLDLEIPGIIKRLETFQGVKRRFTERSWGTNIIIDDYAHHPTEVKATLEAANSKYTTQRIIAIFQPHTYSRLTALLNDFANALNLADEIYLCPIFGSPREDTGHIDITDLQLLISNAKLLTEEELKQLSKLEHTVFLFMGAGDIQKYEDMLLHCRV